MVTNMHEFSQRLPVAELPVHPKGTLEPEHNFALARRNACEVSWAMDAQKKDFPAHLDRVN